MKNIFNHWLSRSFAVAMLWGSGARAIALPSTVIDSALPSSPPEATLTMPHLLETATWQLVSYRSHDGQTVAAWGEAPATLQFQAGQLTGTTGCNRFFSPYTLDGDRLSIPGGGSTLMACSPDALAQQEAAVLSGLSRVASYSQSGEQLRLLDREGLPVLTLTMQPITDLTQTEWTLMAYHNDRGGLVTLLPDTAITARFDATGGLSGSAGCNTYRATYEQGNNALTVGPAASTRRLCHQPNGIMSQENTYLALLPNVATYTLSRDQLVLKDAEGSVLAQFSP